MLALELAERGGIEVEPLDPDPHLVGPQLATGVEPLGGLLEQKNDEGTKELQCIKTTLLASMQGYAPQVAVEFGRKVLYSADRPTFSELESHVKGKK